ncbi:MAG: response regulator [Anaerolineae bacterium]
MDQKHVLIVDDEAKVGFFLGRTLELSNDNCRVSVARSGEEALEILSSSEVDLLITDLRMPGISGLELIRWVRASSPKTRTILITAYGNDQIEAESRRLEVYRYITKPFDVNNFADVVQGALRDYALTQPGVVIFSDKAFETIARVLERLRYDIGARCIFLADMQGQLLTEVGSTEGLNSTMLLTLLAGGFATNAELARQFGGGEAINFNYHEGSRHDIYSVNVGEDLILAMVYDRQVQKSRIGLVWLYTRRTLDELLEILSSADATTSEQALDDDFGSSLMAELDTIFAEDGDSPEGDFAAFDFPEDDSAFGDPAHSAGTGASSFEDAFGAPAHSQGKPPFPERPKSTESAEGSPFGRTFGTANRPQQERPQQGQRSMDFSPSAGDDTSSFFEEAPESATRSSGYSTSARQDKTSSAGVPEETSRDEGPKSDDGGSERQLFNLEQAIEEGLLPPDFCL